MSANNVGRWRSLETVAALLDETPDGLRKKIERRRKKGADGVAEAKLDGLRARKLGGRWKVMLSKDWEA